MKRLFLTGLMILILGNIIVAYTNQEYYSDFLNRMQLGVLTTLIINFAIVVVLLGLKFSIFGSGIELGDTSVKIVSSIAFMMLLLFNTNIAYTNENQKFNFPIGIGLGSTLLDQFSLQNEIGIGFMIILMIIFVTFISGIVTLISVGSGE